MPDIDVLDSTMHYEEAGSGDPIVLLHGNPTSSFIWRSVIPELTGSGRCLALDLIGFGRSGKPAIDYRFFDHIRYVDAWFEAMELDRVTIVGHDWGGALGFDWASRHPDRVRAIAFMEAIPRPQTWDEWEPPEARDVWQAFRSPKGEELVLDQNFLIEVVLQAGMNRELSDDEMEAYRAPFRERDARYPMLSFPRDIPMEGEPPDVVARVEAYSEWLCSSPEVPKLLLTVEPGGIVTAPVVEWCREHIASLMVHPLGEGIHYVQEDHGPEIGRTIAAWMQRAVTA